jgi:DNA repair and recombination protein RAD52
MIDNSSIQENLSKPLNAKHVSTRKGAGDRTLSYIEWHHACREANSIFGFGGWSSETLEMQVLCDEKHETSGKWIVAYRAKCRVSALGVSFDGYGYGEGKDSSRGQAHESALKEAESDAEKRALRHFGDRFGLALYDKEQAHVEDEKPAPPKYPGAGAYLKDFGLSAEEVKAFRNRCQALGREWGEVALTLKARGITKESFSDSVEEELGEKKDGI